MNDRLCVMKFAFFFSSSFDRWVRFPGVCLLRCRYSGFPSQACGLWYPGVEIKRDMHPPITAR